MAEVRARKGEKRKNVTDDEEEEAKVARRKRKDSAVSVPLALAHPS